MVLVQSEKNRYFMKMGLSFKYEICVIDEIHYSAIIFEK